MAAHAHRMLDLAWELGIRYFDAARSYGRAEAFLSSWLQQRRREPGEITVGSKWGYAYRADWQVTAEIHEEKAHTVARLEQQWAESHALLGPHLDLYQIHSATPESGVLRRQKVLKRLAELRASGIAVGLSSSGPQQAATILEALPIESDGRPLFTVFQITWNVLEQTTTTALQAAHEAGRVIIVKEALANGRLTSRNQRPDFAAARTVLEALAAAHKSTVDAIALAAVLHNPWATVVLSGAAQEAHLRSNAAALNLELSSADRERLASLREPPEAYWATRAGLEWN